MAVCARLRFPAGVARLQQKAQDRVFDGQARESWTTGVWKARRESTWPRGLGIHCVQEVADYSTGEYLPVYLSTLSKGRYFYVSDVEDDTVAIVIALMVCLWESTLERTDKTAGGAAGSSSSRKWLLSLLTNTVSG